MARRKRPEPNVKLIENVESDPEAVARALESWAVLLADHAERRAVEKLRQQSPKPG